MTRHVFSRSWHCCKLLCKRSSSIHNSSYWWVNDILTSKDSPVEVGSTECSRHHVFQSSLQNCKVTGSNLTILLATCAPEFHPATTKPTTTPGHDQLHPVNCLLFYKTTPTQEHGLLNLAEPPNLMGLTRFASTACLHKVHSWGAAVPGHWFSPKLTNWCSLWPRRSHTHYDERQEAAPLWTLPWEGDTPFMHPPVCTF